MFVTGTGFLKIRENKYYSSKGKYFSYKVIIINKYMCIVTKQAGDCFGDSFDKLLKQYKGKGS